MAADRDEGAKCSHVVFPPDICSDSSQLSTQPENRPLDLVTIYEYPSGFDLTYPWMNYLIISQTSTLLAVVMTSSREQQRKLLWKPSIKLSWKTFDTVAP
jgi:hypothetical protein